MTIRIRTLRYVILFALLLAMMPHAAEAQQQDYRLRVLTMDEGLPSNSVRAIEQDRKGYIWIATDNGLTRYDGVNYRQYEMGNTRGRQSLTALSVIDDRQMLVGTQGGVCLFHFDTEKVDTLPISINTFVTSLALDGDGRLWVSSAGQGVVSCMMDGTEEKAYKIGNGMVSQVFVDADNQIWALSHGQSAALWRLNQRNDVFEPALSREAKQYEAFCMTQTADGNRWLGTWEDGLMLIGDDGTLTPMPQPQSGHCLHIHALLESSPGHLLIACDDGLLSFDISRRSYSVSLSQRFVYAVTRDHEGGIWAGTLHSGVTYLSPIAHRFSATPGSVISDFVEDANGRIWVASGDKGVLCYHSGVAVTSLPGIVQLSRLNARSLTIDGTDLWIGTYTDGIYLYSTTDGRLRHYDATRWEDGSFSPSIFSIDNDDKGNIWVATMDGIYTFDRKADCFRRICQLPSVCVDIDIDSDGRLWISTQGGGLVVRQPDGKLRTYTRNPDDEHSLSDNTVNCVHVGRDGIVWVGTQGGLCRYDAKTDGFERVRLNVPRQAVASIVEDQGVLWVAGSCGVLKYSKDEPMLRFTRLDGLVSEQFQPNSALQAGDGAIYFGTSRGFNYFYPYQVKVNQQSPTVVITSFEILNHEIAAGSWRLPQAIDFTDRVDIYYYDDVVSFSFASLSYCAPEKNLYAYMLEGFDKDWIYVDDEHRVTYTNLSTGTYTFRVRATNNDGLWSDREARITVVVHPHFLLSIWAMVFYALCFVFLLWLYVRLRVKRAERRHKKEMAQFSEAKDQEVRDARMEFFTMIAHEIRTPVSLILGPLETIMAHGQNSTELQTINRNAQRLLELVNQLLDFRKVEQRSLEMHFAAHNVKEIVGHVADNFAPSLRQRGLQFTVNMPQDPLIVAVDGEAITKVVSNLLSNANKYARNSVTLTLSDTPDINHFTIDVEDDGRGISEEDQKHIFEAFYQGKGNKPGTGIGLSIVKGVVDMHHGTVNILSREGHGTIFHIILPRTQDSVNEEAPQSASPAPMAAPAPGSSAPVPGSSVPVPNGSPLGSSSPAKPRLLIVDDNEEMLTFLVTTFMDTYDVTPAHDGTEALSLLRSSASLSPVSIAPVPGSFAAGSATVPSGSPLGLPFDLVISDWSMEQMEGPDLCEAMRSDEALASIPFILLTAKTDSQSKIRAMEVGVDAFIEKPFALKYLKACVVNLLKKSHRRS